MQIALRGPIDRKRVPGGLAAWQLASVTGHVEARLSSGIKMDELAQLAGLSTSQFTRAFRRSTGMTPHRWHLKERIRRAQQWMLDTDQPLVEIALAIGFADQSHFANTFTRLVGVSPGVWRREQRLGPDRAANFREVPLFPYSEASFQNKKSKPELDRLSSRQGDG